MNHLSLFEPEKISNFLNLIRSYDKRLQRVCDNQIIGLYEEYMMNLSFSGNIYVDESMIKSFICWFWNVNEIKEWEIK